MAIAVASEKTESTVYIFALLIISSTFCLLLQEERKTNKIML